ncbi:hypothetical protein OMW55_04820 [Sphingomonas sp. BN140010]|uniref:Uncharacterized protein n=1 Tax=Sphingomonas arvum TaxID=2992113 RepID=A0ABT3JDP4_9SPHN|nr:hypothetical protein [Sphingomonas sp. BN140010]MCW3797129.1 hypothetical protein [Sphingomonas sp. BN140010]
MLNRRLRDPVFARAEARALKTGIAALEAELVHSALAALGEQGESDWLDDLGPMPGGPGAAKRQAPADLPGTAFPMSADDAMLMLSRYWRKQERQAAGRVRAERAGQGRTRTRAAGSRRNVEVVKEPRDHAADVTRLAEHLAQFGARVLAGEE